MEIPTRGPRPTGLPSIYVDESNAGGRYRTMSRSSSYNSSASPTSIPMPIPNAREPVPPPLPPPRHLADIASGGVNGPDIAWRWGNSYDKDNLWGGSVSSVAPGSSLLGGSRNSGVIEERPEYTRRQSSTATIKSPKGRNDGNDNLQNRFDEGYHSLSGTSVSSTRYASHCPFHHVL